MTDSPKHATFSIEHHHPHSPDQVFQAWSEPEIKAEWFAGPDASHQLQFWVGGQEITQGESDDVQLKFVSTYQEIRHAQLIVYASRLFSDSILATISVTTVEFLPEGEGTRMVLTEYGVFLDGMEDPSWREQGTHAWLERLSSQLAQRQIAP